MKKVKKKSSKGVYFQGGTKTERQQKRGIDTRYFPRKTPDMKMVKISVKSHRKVAGETRKVE